MSADRHLDMVRRVELRGAAAGVRPPLEGATFAGPAQVEYQGIAEPLPAAIDHRLQRANLDRFGQKAFGATAQSLPITHPLESESPVSADLRLIITTLLPRSL